MHYHQLSFSLDTFKFDMIADDSFLRLTERITMCNSFSNSSFIKIGPPPERYQVRSLQVTSFHVLM